MQVDIFKRTLKSRLFHLFEHLIDSIDIKIK